jgi:DNA-binding response OmpR family regulator
VGDSVEQGRAGREDVTVLIIDDDPGVCLRLRTILEEEGYGVTVVSDGPQALRELHRACPRVVLLDFDLPVRWEEHIAAELQSAYGRTIAVIMLSAGVDGRIRAYQVDAEGFFSKPFGLEDLGTRVAEAVGV